MYLIKKWAKELHKPIAYYFAPAKSRKMKNKPFYLSQSSYGLRLHSTWSIIILLLLLLGTSLSSCSDTPSDIRELIALSDNEQELEASIDYFKEDSLKTEALFFLLRNMPRKGTKNYVERTRSKEEVQHDWGQYEGYDEAKKEKERLGIHVHRKDAIPDLQQITADFLIRNIEDAFELWQQPWGVGISFSDFCEYILPYRDRFEPLTSNWRSTTRSLHKDIAEGSQQEDGNVELCAQINDSLKANFAFNYNYTLGAPYPSIQRLQDLGEGPCPYMTSLTLYTMRAFGLPVARDFAPYWSNIHHFSSHEWNAVLGQDGQWYPFMGCEANPRTYQPIFQAPKVFRETYSQQESAIHKLLSPEEIPDRFRRKDLVDVTNLYYPAGDLSLSVSSDYAQEPILYLAVFNQRQWRVAYWGEVEAEQVTFKNMAQGVVYQLMSYQPSRGYRPIGDPVLFDKNGSVRSFAVGEAADEEQIALSTFGLGSLGSNDYRNPLTEGDTYTLNYWTNGEWKIFDSAKAVDGLVHFEQVPDGAIFTLARNALNRTSGEQLFELVDGEQIFW